MNWEQEQKLKEASAHAGLAGAPAISPSRQAAQESCGKMDANDCCATPGLQERLRSRLRACERNAQRGAQMHELLYLLERHPEVARILELFEAVGH